ncbi:SGNH/GDSL hydrolase family protein [Coraliomargarita algicola]|uniref:SGNH/GDSL hydrolase family protein n=1 Tax=Coraliomargarita algicola TaxID=3092156 RepID=A0ABZ0RLM2_9BACT|nr:SGNH/GDSL hydrolase family protein [Coraliomargarita sp. J2-16]WPJ96432.1 SGNH/GDSL hydrolase family protein [Coraliomargarita sp. J2-16]
MTPETPPSIEPRNAAEAQLQNEFASKVSAETYQKWLAYVASSQPEKKAWLQTLEANLGGFYFPHYLNETLFKDDYDPNTDCWAYVKDDPKLARLLIIGDSISRAYTATVRQLLREVANVHRAPANCGPSSNFMHDGETWLLQNGSNQWDYIIVNFGIHDGKNPDGYEQRLRLIFERLKATKVRQIFWVRTTPWGLDASVFDNIEGDSSRITNPTSDRIALEFGLNIIDAHALMHPLLHSDLNRSDFSHWTEAAYQLLGNFIANEAKKKLPK